MSFSIRKLAAIVGLGVTVLLGVLIIEVLRLNTMYVRTGILEAEVRELKNLTKSTQQTIETIRSNKASTDVLSQSFVTSSTFLDLLSGLKVLADSVGVELEVLHISEEVAGKTELFVLDLRTTGDWDKSRTFFEKVEELPYVYKINNTSFSRSEVEGNQVWVGAYTLEFVRGHEKTTNE